MMQQDNGCHDLLQACLSADIQQRLNAYEVLLTTRCLGTEQMPFLLERLNAATPGREKAAILKLLVQLEEPLSEEVLEALLEGFETLEPSLQASVVNAMALTQTEEVCNLLYCQLEDYLAGEEG